MERINLTESPRPQLSQGRYVSLNGEWEFDFDDAVSGPEAYIGRSLSKKIMVPFAYQAKASGIGVTKRHDHVVYRKMLRVDDPSKSYILHFEGADYELRLYVNGVKAGEDEGAYHRMSFDITSYLKDGDNEILVYCDDDYSKQKPRGKQRWEDENFGCWYVDTTGIYKEVWLEVVEKAHMLTIEIRPNAEDGTVSICGTAVGSKIEAFASYDGKPVGHAEDCIQSNAFDIEFKIDGDIHLWDLGKGELYDLTLIVSKDGIKQEARSYFAFKDVEAKHGKVFLNGKRLYQQLILDQGYWEGTGLTPPSNKALLEDITMSMTMGFNGARKHQKVEDERFLYYADCLGYLVWAEMPSMYELTELSKKRFNREWELAVRQQLSHPCIITYVPFNESWGVYDIGKDKSVQDYVDQVVAKTKLIDRTRFVISNDGWEHTDSSLITLHHYEQDAKKFAVQFGTLESALTSTFDYSNKKAMADGHEYAGQPVLITEFGGAAYVASTKENGNWGYGQCVKDDAEFIGRFDSLVSFIAGLPYCEGYCYTQLSDVEQEVNGLLTHDHHFKVDPGKLKAIQDKAASSRE